MKKKIDKEGLYYGIATFLAVSTFITFYVSFHSAIKQSNYYTIGIVDGISTSDAGSFVNYNYNVGDIKYYHLYSLDENSDGLLYHPKKGERYLVKYVDWYPQWSIIYVDKPIPDSIREAPKKGWIGLPKDFKK